MKFVNFESLIQEASSREIDIMELFKIFMTQTNSVEVADEDPLMGMSWFSGDFSGENHLDTVVSWAERRN